MGAATANAVHSGSAGDCRDDQQSGPDELLRDLDAAGIDRPADVPATAPGSDAVQPEREAVRKKGTYIGAPACFKLEMALQHVKRAFGDFGAYQVGSTLERPDWRDVDVRYILPDDEFQKLFPDAWVFSDGSGAWEQDSRWLLLTVSISAWLKEQTGLPVDFQFQPQTHANARHKKPRNALGLFMAKRSAHQTT